MRRRFNHNARVIQELYGRNFSLESLLSEDSNNQTNNEQDAKQLVSNATAEKITQKVKQKFKNIFRDNSVNDNAIKQKGFINIIVNKAQIQNDDGDNAINRKLRRISDDDIKKAILDVSSNNGNKGTKKSNSGSSNNGGSSSGGSGSGSGGSGGSDTKTGGATSKTEKIKEIQTIIGTDSDGKWGPKTNAAWKTWVTSNKDKIIKYLQDTNKDETGDGIENLQAAELAGKGGHDKNLDGVYEFCIAIKESNFEKEGEDKKDGEGSKEGDESWKANRWKNVEQAKKAVNALNVGNPETYDAWPMMGSCEVAVGKALQDGKLHVGFVRTKSEFTGALGEENFMDLIQSGGYSSIEDFVGFGDEPLNIYSDTNEDIDVSGTKTSGDLYYDEFAKELLLDSTMGDYIIKGIYLTDDKKYLKYDLEKYKSEFNDEGEKIVKESRMTLAGKMILGESRAELYRRRYHGRY